MLRSPIVIEENGFPVEFTTQKEVARAIAQGRLRAVTAVRRVDPDGAARWRLASDMAELRPLFGLEPMPELSPEPEPEPEPEPGPDHAPAIDFAPRPRRPIFDQAPREPAPLPASVPGMPRLVTDPGRTRTRADDFDAMMLLPLKRYAVFKGRARRREFWTFYGTQIALYLCLALFGNDAARGEVTITGLFWLALLIPNIALMVRRLHDRDMSGWIVLLGLIPYVGWIVLMLLALFDGDRGPNRFGEDPKA
jgi:uncharacterized membrane protein YhaH (DUF805 family)